MSDNKLSLYEEYVVDAIQEVQKSKKLHFLMAEINKYNYSFIQNNIINANNLIDLNKVPGNIEYSCSFSQQILFTNIREALDEKHYQEIPFIIEQYEKESDTHNVIDPFLELMKIRAAFLFWIDNLNFASVVNDGLSIDDDMNEQLHGVDNNHILSLMNTVNSNLIDADTKFGRFSQPINLTTILEKISKLILSLDKSKDHYVLSALYLMSGKLLLMKNEKAYAVDKLTRSLKFNPYNWEAYEEIIKSISSPNEINILSEHLAKEVKKTVLFDFFQIKCWDEFFESIDAELYIDLLTTTFNMFPTSKFLMLKNADLAYKLNDLPQSEFLYDKLLERYPFCLDTMFNYSNILYVTENYPKLKDLMIKAKSVNEMSCEYQAIHGNLESLLANNEMAIIHFKTAIKLAKTDFAKKCKLYVLIGHEFVELGNYHAAIFAYRNAVRQDPCDYAAWMGLGFAYDILEQPKFAIYYYQKCISIKCEDPRAWSSIAASYIKVDKLNLAYNAYEAAYKFSESRIKKMAIVEEILYILRTLKDVEKQEKWLKVMVDYPEMDDYKQKGVEELVNLYRNTGRGIEAAALERSIAGDQKS